jgi:hypothetical protein
MSSYQNQIKTNRWRSRKGDKIMKRCLIIITLVYLIFGACLVNAQKLVPAPNFSLVDVSDKIINLSDFEGKNVILVFYVNHA